MQKSLLLLLNIQSKWTVHKNITALLQLSTYTTGLHRATINNSVEGRRALLPRVSCSFRPKQENAKAVWTSMCVKSQLSLQSLHVWKHIHLTQTLFLEFLSTHYYYCIQTISLQQRRGGEGCLGTKLTSSSQKRDGGRMGREGKCDLSKQSPQSFFPWRPQTQHWLNSSRYPSRPPE